MAPQVAGHRPQGQASDHDKGRLLPSSALIFFPHTVQMQSREKWPAADGGRRWPHGRTRPHTVAQPHGHYESHASSLGGYAPEQSVRAMTLRFPLGLGLARRSYSVQDPAPPCFALFALSFLVHLPLVGRLPRTTLGRGRASWRLDVRGNGDLGSLVHVAFAVTRTAVNPSKGCEQEHAASSTPHLSFVHSLFPTQV